VSFTSPGPPVQDSAQQVAPQAGVEIAHEQSHRTLHLEQRVVEHAIELLATQAIGVAQVREVQVCGDDADATEVKQPHLGDAVSIARVARQLHGVDVVPRLIAQQCHAGPSRDFTTLEDSTL
jgi:hypothetical protein